MCIRDSINAEYGEPTTTDMAVAMEKRPFDIVVFGATGFSGKLLAEYLTRNYASQVKVALAGRNQKKLEAVRAELAKQEPLAQHFPILIGNSDNLEELTAIAEQTRCVASTVGPYAKYGTPLVEACALSGTSYCDLTGEPNWHATMFNRFETLANKTGARIVHQAGFDSVPSDIGAMLAAQTFQQKFGRAPEEIQMFVALRGGGVQGGTIDTVMNEFENGKAVAQAKRASKEGAPALPAVGKTRLVWPKGVSWNALARKWCIPFFMAGANMPYVARSNGRLGYSPNLVYSEQMMSSSFVKSLFTYIAMVVFAVMLYIRPTRWFLKRFVLPAPGQGPSMEVCEKASYGMLFCATGGSDRADVKIDATGDASCISTTCCLAETAMALSKDTDKLKSPGGVMTAAAALENVLLERLQATPLFKIAAQAVSAAKSKM
eukprot:TRINITY_DN3433_c0_g1_i2.p1 TRINITY_DN3433_c0_g1~~TRINITY_DN3433_c0_g1_i2.p1  ORF type:complete len:433 (-),score=123.55 TRINITY_DN3433_c0_g1_i2:213-1511(-)